MSKINSVQLSKINSIQFNSAQPNSIAKNQHLTCINKGKKSGNKNSRPIHNSPTPTEIVKEALEIGKRFGISVVGDETPAIKRITRSLRNKIENNEQV